MTRSSRILFVDPSVEILRRGPGHGKQTPLLGLTSVASWAAAAGFQVGAWDCAIHPEGLGDFAADFQPLLIGLTSTTPFFHAVQSTSRELKQRLPGVYLVLGGAQASAAPRQCLDACPELDAVVVGEGEETLVDLARALERGERNPVIPGMISRGRPTGFRPRPLITDLDRLPFPDWSLYDYAGYEPVFSHRLGEPAHLFQVQASRGCPNQCSFCFNIFGDSWRLKSPARVAAEVFHNAERHGARHFEFMDPVMPSGQRWFTSLCQALEAGQTRGRIAWGFQTRADRSSGELYQTAANAGCERVLFGLESGSQAILNRMGKGIDLADSWAAVEAAVKAGLKVQATLIIGHPGETRETLDMTREMVQSMRARFAVEFFPAFLGVYPGTAVHEQLENGIPDARWMDGCAPEWRDARRDHPAVECGGLSARELTDFMRELSALVQAPPAGEPVEAPMLKP